MREGLAIPSQKPGHSAREGTDVPGVSADVSRRNRVFAETPPRRLSGPAQTERPPAFRSGAFALPHCIQSMRPMETVLAFIMSASDSLISSRPRSVLA